MLRALFAIALIVCSAAHADRLMEHVRVLSGELPIEGDRSLSNRFSEENKRMVRRYLARVLRREGIESHRESFATDVPRFGGEGTKRGVNLIAEIAGDEHGDEVVEIVSHYDSEGPTVLGADDNASGVAVSLELARLLKRSHPGRTIRFVFCDLEESGFWGSRYRAGRDAEDKEHRIVGALVVDMVGYHPRHLPFQLDLEVGTSPVNRALASRVLTQERRGLKLVPITRGASPEWSDHGSYWARGIPALLLAESVARTNPAYHTPDDRVNGLNPRFFRTVAQFLFRAVTRLAHDGKTTQRDLLARRERARAPVHGGVLNRWYEEKVRTPAGMMSRDEAQSYQALRADLASLDAAEAAGQAKELVEKLVRRWDLISGERLRERLSTLLRSLGSAND